MTKNIQYIPVDKAFAKKLKLKATELGFKTRVDYTKKLAADHISLEELWMTEKKKKRDDDNSFGFFK